MVTKARQLAEFIANADVDSDEIATGAVSASKLADTLDLSSKTIVMPDVAAFNITSGDIGIGTDSPSAPLHVQRTTDASIRIKNTVNNANTIQHLELYNNDETGFLKLGVGRSGSGGSSTLTSASEMRFLVNSAERMRIDTSGRVGIKNSSTDISGTSLDDLVVGAGTTLAGMVLDGGASNDTAYGFASAGTKVGRIQYINSSNNMVFQTNNANRMVIDGSGKVGIGTTSPNGKFEVYDNAGVGGSNYSQLIVEQTSEGGSAALSLTSRFTNVNLTNAEMASIKLGTVTNGSASASADIRFETINSGTLAEGMRIQANGDVRFGIGNSHTPLIQGVTNNGRIASSPGYSFNGDLNTGMFQPATFDTIAFATAGTERMRIDASGRVGIGTTSPASAAQLDVDQTIKVGNMHGSDYDGSTGVMLSHSKSLTASTQTNVLRLGNREGCFILTVYIGWSDSGAAAVAQYDVHTFYGTNTVTQVKSAGRSGGNSVSLAVSSSTDYHTFQVTTSQNALVTITIVGTSAGRTGVGNHFTVDYY